MDPLYIFLDLEAAHGDIFFGDIVEIAAQVDPDYFENEIFNSLINTKQNLAFFTLKVSKITRADLKGKKYFPEVFLEFIGWVKKVVGDGDKKYNKSFYPVLVAHGGFDSDFMMIQSNLERNEMDVNILNEYNLHFADTYNFAKKLKSNGVKCLQGCQLSIECLFRKLHPKDPFIGQHRALPDVQFMIKIFQQSPLKQYFSDILIVTFEKRKIDYMRRCTSKQETQLLNENLPKGLAKVTHTMTLKRLLRNGLTLKRLQELFQNSISLLEFYDTLKDLGIERKASKAMASRLGSMGISCKGKPKECYEDESGSLPPCRRSDSGYESILVTQETTDFFYEMYVDEFFYPPEIYEYTFGSFAMEEIQKMDIEIDNLFEQLYGEECNDEGDSIKVEKTMLDTHNVLIENKGVVTTKKKAKHENWDDEIPDVVKEFRAPTDRGVLAKVIPIGMTEDNFNGKSLSAKVPLFNFFDNEEYKKVRPIGGIPHPSGKAKRKIKKERFIKKHTQIKNDDTVKLDLSNCQDDRTFVKDKKGEVFLLL